MGGIKRLNDHFIKKEFSRFRIFFGPGIEDIFLNNQNRELKFDQALYETLVEQEYERIIFFSPHRSLFVYDERSLILSREISGFERKILETGPLDTYQALQDHEVSKNGLYRHGMGDVHALRILDTLMRQEDGPLTAIVFLQAETNLKHFEDRRILAGIVGEWAHLGSKNHNSCFLVFAVKNLGSLEEITQDLPVPEIKEVLKREREGLEFISESSLEEIKRALKLVERNGINVQESEKLASFLFREGKTLRHWMNLFFEGDYPGNHLSIQYASEHGWIEAIVKPGENALKKLNSMVGLENVKNRVEELVAWAEVRQSQVGPRGESPNLHMIFSGNPGTGKTTVARLMGEIFHELGWLKRGHLVEVQGGDLVAEFVGGTPKKVNGIIDSAIDGVLFIDEAYALAENERGGYGQEALEILLSRMERDRGRLVVICAGYAEKMDRFRRSNPGLMRRFPKHNMIDFANYDPEALFLILQGMLEDRNLKLEPSTGEKIKKIITEMTRSREEGFGNAGEMRNLADGFERSHALRVVKNGLDHGSPITVEDIPEAYKIYLPILNQQTTDWENDFTKLIGLKDVKEEIFRFRDRLEFEKLRYQAGISGAGKPSIRHFAFVGNPGTGKTTVARLIGKFFHELGLLGKGQVIETNRGELVAGYVGQTAIKTRERFRAALDGVLFIDEAYSLAMGDEFGQEAIIELVKAMEDYRDRLVVIVTGYPEQMNLFLDTNPGLASRFGEVVNFEDFSEQELWEILVQLMESENFHWDDRVQEKTLRYLEWQKIRDGMRFGNGRSVRELFEHIKSRAALRILELIKNSGIVPTPVLISTLIVDDVPDPGFYLQLDPVATTKAIANARV
jgi:SpoVK/Ycf46/Vps4 family AAA+-type ATPase